MGRIIFIFLVVLSGFFTIIFWNRPEVRLNDISTSPDDPPEFIAIAGLPANEGRDMSFSERSREFGPAAYPDLRPKVSNLTPGQAFERVRERAQLEGSWELVKIDPAELRVEAVATTSLMRWKDDVVIEVRPHEEGSVVHMRSKSRVGNSDLGANAARIRAFLLTLDLR